MKRVNLLVPALAVAVLSLGFAGVAEAGMTGPCDLTITIEGTTYTADNDTPSNPIFIPDRSGVIAEWKATTELVIASPSGSAAIVVGPGAVTVNEWASGSQKTEISGTYSIDKALEGLPVDIVGLYEVSGFHRGSGGSCEGTAMILFEGSPLSNPIGWLGLLGTFLALIGFLRSMTKKRKTGRRGKPVLGTLSGLLLGVFLALDLQQFGIRPFDTLMVIGLPAAGLMLGVITQAAVRGGRRGGLPTETEATGAQVEGMQLEVPEVEIPDPEIPAREAPAIGSTPSAGLLVPLSAVGIVATTRLGLRPRGAPEEKEGSNEYTSIEIAVAGEALGATGFPGITGPLSAVGLPEEREAAHQDLIDRGVASSNNALSILQPHLTTFENVLGPEAMLTVQHQAGLQVETRFFYRGDVAIEQSSSTPGLHRFVVTRAGGLSDLVVAFTGLVATPKTGEGRFVTTVGNLARADEAARNGDRETTAGALSPEASAFVDALLARTSSTSVRLVRRRGERAFAIQLTWLDAGTRGLWLMQREGDQVTVSTVGRSWLLEKLGSS